MVSQRPQATPGELRSALTGDVTFGIGSTRMVHAHSLVPDRGTYVYRFGFRSTAVNGKLGAARTAELPFVFDIPDAKWLHGIRGPLGQTPCRMAWPGDVHRAWISLAQTGPPGWAA